jgi:hypothetical protein
MTSLSKFSENIEWIVASPSADSVGLVAEFLVSHQAIRCLPDRLRTYVLINFKEKQLVEEKNGQMRSYQSVLYRFDFSKLTTHSRISALAFFSKKFARGDQVCTFFYRDQPWEKEQTGFSAELCNFIINHSIESDSSTAVANY